MTSPQSKGLELNMGSPRAVAFSPKRKTPPVEGRHEGKRRARLSSPFPYAGPSQFRFEGCALRLGDSLPATPNDAPAWASDLTVPRSSAECKRRRPKVAGRRLRERGLSRWMQHVTVRASKCFSSDSPAAP